MASVSCSPKVSYYDEVHGVERKLVASECIGTAGEWSTKFAAIEIDVDTTEATALLLGSGGLPLWFARWLPFASFWLPRGTPI